MWIWIKLDYREDADPIVLSVLHLFKESAEFVTEGVLSKLGKQEVTGSAFSQARYKIEWQFFSDLCAISSADYDSFSTARWKGYRVLGVDGSTLNLPASKQIREYFGVETNSLKTSLARILLVYDVLTGLTLQARLGRMSTGESGLLDDCLTKIPSRADDLLVLDRNFGYFHIAQRMTCEGRPFCIRMSTGGSNFAKGVMADTRMDFITDWLPSKSERETAKTSDPVRVRVTKAVLETGETELLVSSLQDMELFKTRDLVELYGMRWGVEEGIKNLKSKIKVEQFGCRKPGGIYQEFYAHILAMNMVALAGIAATEEIEKKNRKRKKKRKLIYKYNWKNAFLQLRERIVDLFSRESVEKILEILVAKIARKLVAVKKGRKFSRKGLGKAARINQYYK
ncbi:MAG: IS4 family transposase [Cyclobacteriaceae bacterium]